MRQPRFSDETLEALIRADRPELERLCADLGITTKRAYMLRGGQSKRVLRIRDRIGVSLRLNTTTKRILAGLE